MGLCVCERVAVDCADMKVFHPKAGEVSRRNLLQGYPLKAKTFKGKESKDCGRSAGLAKEMAVKARHLRGIL